MIRDGRLSSSHYSLLQTMRNAFISISEGLASFNLFPPRKTLEELQEEMTRKYQSFGIDFTKDDKQNLADDMRAVGNDMRKTMYNLK